MDLQTLTTRLDASFSTLIAWLSGPQLYAQLGLVLLAIIVAYWVAATLRRRAPLLTRPPESGPWLALKMAVHRGGVLLFPLLVILLLGVAVELGDVAVQQSWLARIAQSLAVVFLLYSLIVRFIKDPVVDLVLRWIMIPIAVLHVLGWLDDITAYLDTIDLEIGSIRISAYGLARAVVFGCVLFWLGRLSNRAGQRIIRNHKALDAGTREVAAKLFQVVLFVVIFLLLLQIMGINLTALAVFGGALGVGLGFGLQAIASNFISGMIILLDRSLKVGDFIELDDGRTGTIREITMRSTVLETFDGKDVVVPNEHLITTRFVNWSHRDDEQRYALEFQVAYDTDLPGMLEIVRKVVRSHPQVIDEPDTPTEKLADAEIAGFGDSGVNVLVEFWMHGIDDGVNRVGADLRMMIWQALEDNGIEIPFPQREVRILNADGPTSPG